MKTLKLIRILYDKYKNINHQIKLKSPPRRRKSIKKPTIISIKLNKSRLGKKNIIPFNIAKLLPEKI